MTILKFYALFSFLLILLITCVNGLSGSVYTEEHKLPERTGIIFCPERVECYCVPFLQWWEFNNNIVILSEFALMIFPLETKLILLVFQ